jgi:protein-S-isoprenylcysteine O-methyltransferase Ste14
VKYLVAIGLALFMVSFALGIPLLGWGITDLAGFFSNLARALYSIGVGLFALSVSVGFLFLPFPYMPGQREGERSKMVSRQNAVPILTRLVWLAIFIISPFSDRRNIATLGEIETFRYIGLLLFVLGLVWVGWAFLVLGKQHSPAVTIQMGHQLVTNGPYRWLRHPMYLGLVVFPMGVGLVFRSWIGSLLPLLLIGIFIWRIGDEEQLMHREFGKQWEVYCQHTWRFIPFIY